MRQRRKWSHAIDASEPSAIAPGRDATERLASVWRAGYADPGLIDALEDAADAPLDRFIALIPDLDLD